NPEGTSVLLENKVAVITGIGPGLGRELAVQFAREGAAVVMCASTESYLEEVRAEIDGAGGRVVAVPTDIADREHCERIVAAAVAAFGGGDTVVQNAFAFPPFALFEDADLDTWNQAMDVTVWGSLNLAQAVLP